MDPRGDLPTTAWWERKPLGVQQCRAASRASATSEVGCSYHTWVTMQCRVVEGADGVPNRRCERLLRKYRDCGRGQEEIEVVKDERTDLNYRGDDQELQDPDHAFRRESSGPLDADVGEAVEEFLHRAEELQQKLAEDPLGLTPKPAARRRSVFEPEVIPQRSFLARLFMREAECSPRRCYEKTWEEFSKDFQEV